jgi:iron complex transport system substrate-binding protein
MSQPVTLRSPRTLAPIGASSSAATPKRSLAALMAVVAGFGLAGAVAAPQADARTYKRVVTLTPFGSNVVARLGVRPVAVGNDVASGIRLHSGLARVPRLTLSHPDGPNLEQLLRLKPDLLLSSPNWRVGNAKLRRRKLAVSDAWEPTKVNNVSPSVRRIAKLVGRSSRANAITRQIDGGIRAARVGIRSNPRVLLVLGVGRQTIAFLPNSWGADMVRYAGGRLVTGGLRASFDAGLPGSFAPLSDEEVLRRNPDVIIVVPHGNRSSLPNTVKFFRNKPGWKGTKAARNNRIHVADADNLLQASDNPGGVIRYVRRSFLRN